MTHVVFFDGQCPLCHSAVRKILALDQKNQFLFAPLMGKTAQKSLLPKIKNPLDTLVLLENYKTSKEAILVEGKAVLRIAYHLGGFYRLMGLFSFLPSSLFNSLYRLIAKNRFSLFKKAPPLDKTSFKERFLP